MLLHMYYERTGLSLTSQMGKQDTAVEIEAVETLPVLRLLPPSLRECVGDVFGVFFVFFFKGNGVRGVDDPYSVLLKTQESKERRRKR